MLAGFCPGLGWKCTGPTADWDGFCWWGVSCIPLVPLGWFKANAGLGHSLAMWPHPWHLKHWREFGSHLLAVLSPPCASPLVALTRATSTIVRTWAIGGITTIAAPPMASLLRATWYTRGIVALFSLGQGTHEPGYLLSYICHSFPWISCYGVLPLPCPRYPCSSSLLYKQWPSAVSSRFCECYIDIRQSCVCVSRLCGKDSPWGTVGAQDPLFSWGMVVWFEGPFGPHGKRGDLLIVTLHNLI